MNIKQLFPILLLVCVSIPLCAYEATPATKESIPLAEEFVSIMHFENNFESMKSKLTAMISPQKPAGIPQEAWDRVTKQSQQTMESVFASMTWEKMKPMYVSIYAETFSPEELKGLIAFYKTPVGQKYIEKQPELQTAIIQKSQAMMKDVIPSIMKSMPLPVPTGSSTPIQPIPSGTGTPMPTAIP